MMSRQANEAFDRGIKTQGVKHLNSLIGIFGSSPGYSKRLAAAINARHDVGYTAVAFNTSEELERFLEKKTLSILLSDNEAHSELLKNPSIFCLLTDNPESDCGGASIFKFQSASAIIKSIILLNPEDLTKFNNVYTVFSPASCALAHQYAEHLAKELALKGKTLLLSWDYFSGIGREENEPAGKTISDLLFTARKNETGMKKLLSGLMRKEGYDFFCGTDFYADLWQYSREEMETLIDSCKRNGGYENLVFSCGFFSDGVEALLENSNEIFLVKQNDTIGTRRNMEFMRQMKYAGKQTILSKISEVNV